MAQRSSDPSPYVTICETKFLVFPNYSAFLKILRYCSYF